MKVSLKRVEEKAIADSTFWKKVRANADETLAENRMELSTEDRRRLGEILELDGRTVKVDLASFMTRARRSKRPDRLFWMGMWDSPGLPTDRGRPGAKKKR
jgi:hypothetical protein